MVVFLKDETCTVVSVMVFPFLIHKIDAQKYAYSIDGAVILAEAWMFVNGLDLSSS